MPGAKIQPNNPANDPELKPVKGHSKFKPNLSLYKTHTFGLIEPHYAGEVVPDDKNYSYRSGADVDTLSLKAPVMTPMKMSKDTFFVPLRAILPNNADLITTNPLTGDDIVPEAVNSVLYLNRMGSYSNHLIQELLADFNSALKGYTRGSTSTAVGTHLRYVTNLLGRTLQMYSYASPFLSYGSLAQSLGYNFAAGFQGLCREDGRYLDFDETLEVVFSHLVSLLKSFEVTFYEPSLTTVTTVNNKTILRRVSLDSSEDVLNGSLQSVLCFRSLLELLQQGAVIQCITVKPADLRNPGSSVEEFPYSELGFDDSRTIQTHNYAFSSLSGDSVPKEYYFNLQRLIAYQLACVAFYTDDAVDYVYSAKLWHQNMLSLARTVIGSNEDRYRLFYELNGVAMMFDSVSGNVIRYMYESIAATGWAPVWLNSNPLVGDDTFCGFGTNAQFTPAQYFAWQYINNIFGYQRSLRYRDYFVGSRKYPLAVGDVNVAVNSNQVDVVDITRNIQMQRFLNQVNRVGRRIREYSAGIFGVAPRKEVDDVIYLSHVDLNIGAEETSNTGSAQLTDAQTITSKLRKSGSNFVFSSDFNEFGIVIGVTYFDVIRPYIDGADRTLHHIDRFDMFNPYMQHIGDQPVSTTEIAPVRVDTFGYKLRYSEYKQRTDRIAGGFKSFLPGFAFPTDVINLMNPLADQPSILEISPDFIRSRPHEFDKFFVSLTHYTPAGYFHFIIRHDNEVTILRPMEAAPSIL